MTDKLLTIISVVLFGCGAVIIGYVAYNKFGGESVTSKPLMFSEDERVNEILEKDWENLKSSQAAEHHIQGALTRLANLKRDDNTLNLVLQYKDSESAAIRKAVAEALAGFPSETADDALEDLLKDDDAAVRLATIKAMGGVKSRFRLETLVDMLVNENDYNDEEKVALYSSVMRVSNSVEIKAKMTDKLLKIVNSDSKNAYEAAVAVTDLAPRAQVTKEAFVAVLKRDKPPNLVQRAIYYLSSVRSPWLTQRIANYIDDDRELVKVAAIQGLAQLCPNNRHEIVEKILRRKESKAVYDIVASSMFMMFDSKMEQVVSTLKAQTLPEDSSQSLEQLMKSVSTGKSRDICSQPRN